MYKVSFYAYNIGIAVFVYTIKMVPSLWGDDEGLKKICKKGKKKR